MTRIDKFILRVATSTLMIGASTSLAWANCGGNAPSDRGTPGVDYKFASQIQKAKLQALDSGQTVDCISKADMGDADSKNEYFYTTGFKDTESRVVNFLMEGDGNRSELRVEDQDFNIADTSSIAAKLRLRSIEDGLNKVTMMQIHVDNDNQEGPLAALKWSSDLRKSGDDSDDTKTSGLYLTVRQSMDCNSNESLCTTNILVKSDEEHEIGSYHTYILGVYDGVLRLKIDGEEMDLTHEDIFNNSSQLVTTTEIDLTGSDWDYNARELYLKLGIYLNSPGSARVQAKNTKFYFTPN